MQYPAIYCKRNLFSITFFQQISILVLSGECIFTRIMQNFKCICFFLILRRILQAAVFMEYPLSIYLFKEWDLKSPPVAKAKYLCIPAIRARHIRGKPKN